MDIQSSQVSPGSTPLVLVFDLHGQPGLRGQRGMTAGPGLNAGFFICRQNKLIRLQGLSCPDALVKVEDASRFEGKLGISRKDPTTMVPRSDGIFMEPAPDGGFTKEA